MPHVWQTDFPADQARTIAMAVIAKQFTLSLVRPAWEVVEYGIAQVVAPAPAVAASSAPAAPHASDEAAMNQLLAMSNAPPGLAMAAAVDWKSIIKVVMQAILAVLN